MRTMAICLAALALGATASAYAAEPAAAEKDAIFKAAGFAEKSGNYVRCVEDTTSSYRPGSIEMQDLNGDGQPEAWVTEYSNVCFGDTGQGFVLLGKDKSGAWQKLLTLAGIPEIQTSKTQGWPDILVNGPGVGPMPPLKWNGKEYTR
jgi:hypothetical protein